MEWNHLIYFALPAVFCWGMGAMAAYRPGKSLQVVLWTVVGLAIFMAFIVGMWVSLERPPLRTMGETRLWYSFFLPVAGIITYIRWRYKWILSFSTVMSLVFICINLFKPEIHNKTLMPALQSPWFAPHVIVYMFAYAMLGAGTVVAVYLLVRSRKRAIEPGVMNLCDNLVYVGTAFLTIGMLFGALWAKEAWGHYWSWDPKETCALVTMLIYAVSLHAASLRRLRRPRVLNRYLLLAIVSVLFTYFGANYLLPGLHSYA